MANRTKLKEMSPGTRGYFLVFVAALIGDRATVNQNLCLPRSAPWVVVPGDDHDEHDTGDHLRHGGGCWAKKIGHQKSKKHRQDLWHCNLCGRCRNLGVFQRPKVAAHLARRLIHASPDAWQQLGDGCPVAHRQQLLLVALAHLAGSNLQVVHGSFELVGMDILLLHPAIRGCCLLPASGHERVQDPLTLRALVLHLRWCVQVRGELLPAVVVHLGEGSSLLRHVHAPLHCAHHRDRHRGPPRRAARRKRGRGRRHRPWPVRRAVGQSGGREEGRVIGGRSARSREHACGTAHRGDEPNRLSDCDRGVLRSKWQPRHFSCHSKALMHSIFECYPDFPQYYRAICLVSSSRNLRMSARMLLH